MWLQPTAAASRVSAEPHTSRQYKCPLVHPEYFRSLGSHPVPYLPVGTVGPGPQRQNCQFSHFRAKKKKDFQGMTSSEAKAQPAATV